MNKWINVKDRLPEDDYLKEYLVMCKTEGGVLPEGCYKFIKIASYLPPYPKDKHILGNTGYWEVCDYDCSIPFTITHWMPLPEPPKED